MSAEDRIEKLEAQLAALTRRIDDIESSRSNEKNQLLNSDSAEDWLEEVKRQNKPY